MKTRWFALLLVSQGAMLVGCGSDAGSSLSEGSSTEFLGKWRYEQGSQVLVSCPGQTAQPTDLSKARAYIVNEASERPSLLHHVDSLGCNYQFEVKDGVAHALPSQSCDKLPDGRGGTTTLTLTEARMEREVGGAVKMHSSGDIVGGCKMVLDGSLRANP